MKAVVNGVAVEGTPQEIIEYQRMQAEKAERKPFKPGTYPWETEKAIGILVKSPSVVDDGSILGIPKITSGSVTVKRCDHPCYCTGACEGRTPTDSRFMQYAKPYNPSHLMLPGTVIV